MITTTTNDNEQTRHEQHNNNNNITMARLEVRRDPRLRRDEAGTRVEVRRT